MRPQAPVKPQRNRKAMSCDAGTITVIIHHSLHLTGQEVTMHIFVNGTCFCCSVCLDLTVDLCLLSSLTSGTDRESPNNVEKPPNRKPPVKKPRLPKNRNKSLDLSGICLSVFIYVCVCVLQNVPKALLKTQYSICIPVYDSMLYVNFLFSEYRVVSAANSLTHSTFNQPIVTLFVWLLLTDTINSAPGHSELL